MQEFLDFIAQEWMLFAGLIIVSTLLVRSFIGTRISGVTSADVVQVVRLLNDQEAKVLDVRLDSEFKKGHIKDAIHIPVGTLESRIRELEKYKNNALIISCQTGQRSIHAASILKKHGFGTLYNLQGGLNAWINANMPLEKK